MDKTKLDKDSIEFFENERSEFVRLSGRAHLVSNVIGRRIATPRAGIATWIFMKSCLLAQSLCQLCEPPKTIFGDQRYLDHSAVATLCRGMIESVTVLLYLGDPHISDDEWRCRSYVIDIHDAKNRIEMSELLGTEAAHTDSPDEVFTLLVARLQNNVFFQSLKVHRKKILLSGDDMFIEGRNVAIRQLGWSDSHAKGVYKYLSNHAHSHPVSFHRTELNRVYQPGSGASYAVAGFGLAHARLALGAASLRMLSLFADIEAAFDPEILQELREKYTVKVTA